MYHTPHPILLLRVIIFAFIWRKSRTVQVPEAHSLLLIDHHRLHHPVVIIFINACLLTLLTRTKTGDDDDEAGKGVIPC